MKAPISSVFVTLFVFSWGCGTGQSSIADAGSDGFTCGPASVSTYTPAPMTPPRPLHTNRCSASQAMDYAQCTSQQDTSKCSEFTSGQSGFTCAQCIESQQKDPAWGVIVFNGSVGEVNIAGCVDLALAQADAGVPTDPNGCAQLLFASYGCQNAACAGCSGNDFDTCVALELQHRQRPWSATPTCATYDDQVHAPTGPCGTIFTSDVLAAAVAGCFPDTATQLGPDGGPLPPNYVAQETNWLTSVITFMCGM